jgi:hypothetical protein
MVGASTGETTEKEKIIFEEGLYLSARPKVNEFDNTPKALANFSPGLERQAKRQPWVSQIKKESNPEKG